MLSAGSFLPSLILVVWNHRPSAIFHIIESCREEPGWVSPSLWVEQSCLLLALLSISPTYNRKPSTETESVAKGPLPSRTLSPTVLEGGHCWYVSEQTVTLLLRDGVVSLLLALPPLMFYFLNSSEKKVIYKEHILICTWAHLRYMKIYISTGYKSMFLLGFHEPNWG